MKHIYTVLLATFLAPTSLLAGPAEQAKDICDIVDGYTQGSYHYFDCLDHIKKIDSTFTEDQTIDYVCSAVDTFYNMDVSDKVRCYGDAKAKVSPVVSSCETNNLSESLLK
ncbi:MAG TPA: hypothetical protein VE954_23485 [Oligoflexus sp.]|uniref:hypothetical protein n=1 Tax=Oligoflexus sp. TaxID=1971216 RepID=UPI002D3D39CA|nr:hypothetical protein [Oligoflexus sp.]HYX36076.1 hypothetical protein [Oligoflexus sp.]